MQSDIHKLTTFTEEFQKQAQHDCKRCKLSTTLRECEEFEVRDVQDGGSGARRHKHALASQRETMSDVRKAGSARSSGHIVTTEGKPRGGVERGSVGVATRLRLPAKVLANWRSVKMQKLISSANNDEGDGGCQRMEM